MICALSRERKILFQPLVPSAELFTYKVLQRPESARAHWPAPGSEDTELGVFMEPEVSHGETKVYAGVQA